MKNGITYLLQDAKARAKLVDLLAEVMEKYGADNPPPYPVTSVNGQTGEVSLDLGVTSIRADYEGSGAVGVNTGDVSLVGQGCFVNTVYPGRVRVLASKSTIGLGSVANERQYSAQNPPPYPVKSVNGQVGDVSVAVPTATSDLTNDSGFVNAVGAAAAAPVQSVNGQTGDVSVPGISALDVYPVGSIYMSVNSTSPATLFGGTWEQLENRFLLGAGSSYTAGSTGGEETHTLTIDEMPSHNHGFKRTTNAISSGSNFARMATNGTGDDNLITNTGGGQAHNNMPPYLAVYIWKRTG